MPSRSSHKRIRDESCVAEGAGTPSLSPSRRLRMSVTPLSSFECEGDVSALPEPSVVHREHAVTRLVDRIKARHAKLEASLRGGTTGHGATRQLADLQSQLMNPFRYDVLQDILLTPCQDALSLCEQPFWERERADLQCVSREYDVQFLRAPHENEFECAKGETCVARTLPVPSGESPVTLREYYLPDQLVLCQEKRHWAEERQECVLCMLHTIQLQFTHARLECGGLSSTTHLSPLYHLTGVEGEYRLEDCLYTYQRPFLGLWAPVLAFRRSYYEFCYHTDPVTGGAPTRGFRCTAPLPSSETTQYFRPGPRGFH